MLTSGNIAVSDNGKATDEDFDKAVNVCALYVFAQQLKDGSVDPMQHGTAYDEAQEKCRRAIGSLMGH